MRGEVGRMIERFTKLGGDDKTTSAIEKAHRTEDGVLPDGYNS